MMSDSLQRLGWSPHFETERALAGAPVECVARVMDQHKHLVEAEGLDGRREVPLLGSTPPLAVGDWLVLEEDGKVARVLERTSLFRRKAAGHRVAHQVIAANVDIAFVVCGLDRDFNLNRIERYLSLIHESGAEPVVILTKADECGALENRIREVQELDPLLGVVAIDGRSSESIGTLSSWCEPGKTVVLLGSSGAGKSTLTNTLLGEEWQDTGEVRETDGRGRHTTTRRSLLCLPSGALILDTPGMRELQLTDCETGVATTFHDIEELAAQCKFNDCTHTGEPGCAVLAAVKSGELDPRRLASYHKLQREQARNAASVPQRHAQSRKQGKLYRNVQKAARFRKTGRGDDDN